MKNLNSLLVVLVLLVGGGCGTIKNPNLTATQKAEYTVNQNLAAMAKLNRGLAEDVVKADATGLVPKAITNEILTWNKTIATLNGEAVGIMQSPQPWPTRAQAVFAILQKGNLPTNVTGWLNSPSTDQTVKAVIASVSAVQGLIVGIISSTKGVQ